MVSGICLTGAAAAWACTAGKSLAGSGAAGWADGLAPALLGDAAAIGLSGEDGVEAGPGGGDNADDFFAAAPPAAIIGESGGEPNGRGLVGAGCMGDSVEGGRACDGGGSADAAGLPDGAADLPGGAAGVPESPDFLRLGSLMHGPGVLEQMLEEACNTSAIMAPRADARAGPLRGRPAAAGDGVR